ncbi:MAG TPA: hypothetical protein PKM21_15900 [Anaerolineales bacterium]|nr:hypothetical protein [Anaerolineales bacterium]
MTHFDVTSQIAIIGRCDKGYTWLVIGPGQKFGCILQQLLVTEMPCPIVDMRGIPVESYQEILDAHQIPLFGGVDNVHALISELENLGGSVTYPSAFALASMAA